MNLKQINLILSLLRFRVVQLGRCRLYKLQEEKDFCWQNVDKEERHLSEAIVKATSAACNPGMNPVFLDGIRAACLELACDQYGLRELVNAYHAVLKVPTE